MSHKLNDIIEESQRSFLAGEMNLEIKKYLFSSGTTELAERIHESTNQEQSKLIIERLVSSYEGKYGSRLYE